MIELVVIAGQTGSGKSSLAMKLAKHIPAEVVSADSVQVYRGFDIGTAKPSKSEQAALTHHLIDIVEPDETIDAAEYARRADLAIADIAQRRRLPVVVGGTGLWIRALLMGLVGLPPVDPHLRERLTQEARVSGTAAMHARLARVDPLTSAQVHPNDTLRIIRALEVFEQTGTPIGVIRQAHALGEPRYRFIVFAIEEDASSLRPRLQERAISMLQAGWIDEVRELRRRWTPHARPFGSVGYREVCAYLDGTIEQANLAARIEQETWRYAKRQRNWFRAERYVAHRGPREEIESIVLDRLEEFFA